MFVDWGWVFFVRFSYFMGLFWNKLICGELSINVVDPGGSYMV